MCRLPEERKKLAVVELTAAGCLLSNRPIRECDAEYGKDLRQLAKSLHPGSAFADAPDPVLIVGGRVVEPPPNPSPLVRRELAMMHQKHAACLLSDKSMADCRAELNKSIHEGAENMRDAMLRKEGLIN